MLKYNQNLGTLFSKINGIEKIVIKGKKLPNFDYCIPMMSLANILKITLKKLPYHCLYIKPPNPFTLTLPSKTFGQTRIGIVWAGKKTHKNDRNRSCDFQNFITLFSLPNTCFFSLQKGEREGDIKKYNCQPFVFNLGSKLNEFNDTASAISQLDLIISVDTATAHLAGALGKPVWVILPFAADWRWLTKIDNSPWYPTMKLFRQKKPLNWDLVLNKVKLCLLKFKNEN